jgi:prevent-host-death family protein
MLTRNRRSKRPSRPGTWKLQDAKARFSEVVRRARAEGPQRVTVHDKEAVVIVAVEDYVKTAPPLLTGADLIPIMQKGRKLGLKLRSMPVHLSADPPIDFSEDER